MGLTDSNSKSPQYLQQKYKLIRRYTSNVYGDITVIQQKISHTLYISKQLITQDELLIKYIRNRKLLKHRNLISLQDYWFCGEQSICSNIRKIQMIYKYIPNTLDQQMQRRCENGEGFYDHQIVAIFIDLIQCLNYLESNGILHIVGSMKMILYERNDNSTTNNKESNNWYENGDKQGVRIMQNQQMIIHSQINQNNNNNNNTNIINNNSNINFNANKINNNTNYHKQNHPSLPSSNLNININININMKRKPQLNILNILHSNNKKYLPLHPNNQPKDVCDVCLDQDKVTHQNLFTLGLICIGLCWMKQPLQLGIFGKNGYNFEKIEKRVNQIKNKFPFVHQILSVFMLQSNHYHKFQYQHILNQIYARKKMMMKENQRNNARNIDIQPVQKVVGEKQRQKERQKQRERQKDNKQKQKERRSKKLSYLREMRLSNNDIPNQY